MNGSVFEGLTPSEIPTRSEDTVSSFIESGLLVFKKIYASDNDALLILDSVGEKSGWTSRNSERLNDPDASSPSWVYHQNHDKRIESLNSHGMNGNASELIEWHLEGVSMKNTQLAAGWNMLNFKCSSDSGSTGFVDMCELYDDLSEDDKSFLDSCEIIHIPNWQHDPSDPEQFARVFLDHVDNGERTIWVKDGAEYVASYSRLAVEPHPASGRKTLRTCPCHARWGLQDYLLYVDGRKPTVEEKERFSALMEWIRYEITQNEDRQYWHYWSEGDFLITDLFRMAHGVRGGYEPGQRSFTGYWCFTPGTPAEPMPRITDSEFAELGYSA